LVLVEMKRIQTGQRAPGMIAETIAVYASSAHLAFAYLWITFLQLLAPSIAGLALGVGLRTDYPVVSMLISIARLALLAGAGIVYMWLYFAEYALVFDGQHSFHSLLFSRDLMRKRFFTVASRIAVFLAVWWGYNSWAAGAFVIASLLLGPVVLVTGVVSTIVIALNLMGLSVGFATSAFFIAAEVRMYQDLTTIAREGAIVQADSSAALQQATAPLSGASA
jgi:multisubunit Na+/H+ antiporter MnhC subunit